MIEKYKAILTLTQSTVSMTMSPYTNLELTPYSLAVYATLLTVCLVPVKFYSIKKQLI